MRCPSVKRGGHLEMLIIVVIQAPYEQQHVCFAAISHKYCDCKQFESK